MLRLFRELRQEAEDCVKYRRAMCIETQCGAPAADATSRFAEMQDGTKTAFRSTPRKHRSFTALGTCSVEYNCETDAMDHPCWARNRDTIRNNVCATCSGKLAKIGFGLLEVEFHALSIDQHDRGIDQLLAGDVVLLVAAQIREQNEKLD